AAHATPDRLEDKILYVRASSTAWATQLRLMAADILRKIAAAMGPGHVRRLKIEGPAGPSWRKGPLHVSGRGPRDTYGQGRAHLADPPAPAPVDSAGATSQ